MAGLIRTPQYSHGTTVPYGTATLTVHESRVIHPKIYAFAINVRSYCNTGQCINLFSLRRSTRLARSTLTMTHGLKQIYPLTPSSPYECFSHTQASDRGRHS
jgi:hypothetical protein